MSTDFAQMAATLFGSTTPTSQPTSPTPNTLGMDDAMASRMFPNQRRAPSAPAQETPNEPLSDAEQAERLFAGSPIHGDAERATVSALTETGDYTPDEAAEVFETYLPMAEALQLNASESKAAAEVLIGAWKSEPTPALVSSWTEKSVADIAAAYGAQRVAEVLRTAQDYVQGIPELYDLLRGAIGNHPTLVRLVADRAMRARGR